MRRKTEENPVLNRRRFLRCSAAAAAAVALARGGTPPKRQTVLAAPLDPSKEYPWNVMVDERGQILLHLLQAANIDDVETVVFEKPLYYVLSAFHDAVTPATPHRELDEALDNLGFDQGALKDRLLLAYQALEGTKVESWAYIDFATHTPSEWIKTASDNRYVYNRLRNLDHMVTFPPLRSKPAEIRAYVRDWENRIRKPISFKDAFALGSKGPYWSQQRGTIAALKAGREVGLFWCFPAAIGSAGGEYERPPGDQGWRCSNGECIPTGNPDDYCQMQDGSCTPMSG